MKKAVALAAISLLSVVPLVACSSDDDGGDTPSGDTTLDTGGDVTTADSTTTTAPG